MNVVLIGMPGAGKSRLGRALAKATGMEFTDTDKIIRDNYGDIAEIFSGKGEEYFRLIETEAVRTAAGGDGRVISTGGGAVLKPENMEILRKNGLIVYLKADKETLLKRTAGSSRPLLKGNAELNIENLLLKRSRLYEKYADVIVDANSDDVMKKVNYIKGKI